MYTALVGIFGDKLGQEHNQANTIRDRAVPMGCVKRGIAKHQMGKQLWAQFCTMKNSQ